MDAHHTAKVGRLVLRAARKTCIDLYRGRRGTCRCSERGCLEGFVGFDLWRVMGWGWLFWARWWKGLGKKEGFIGGCLGLVMVGGGYGSYCVGVCGVEVLCTFWMEEERIRNLLCR
ncbi:hypothetical protein B0T25DRAFT_265206 [Lasiosphaeria hispida]|uniref:Uncharacterized protein n=1 Tax=Lasiosphaeria hispida TaxID=260671 RepID=A0AAJ0HAP5_9PEZI|nr:hypothetical protein B0T25DRAFT_265206 [Lasiosphaeria hispida]